ncbi:glycoside hydrolase family 32 protein [Halosimplex amylolyticum]|uniref:glycoside hydrolase family 32 protein n=1 Tax=Halosimplex amylolyticum TaxID=3396616 RepID=UPI003F56BCD9
MSLEADVEAVSGEQRREFKRMREGLADDPYRPRYHFAPPAGQMNDPNGALVWNGQYHLFYQFRPPGTDRWHWGHTVSEDLINWYDLPVALEPDPELEEHCFSGQAIVEDDRVVVMYHGVGAGNCIAESDDSLLIDWEKHPENPVIPIDEDAPYRIFDPCIWREGETYYSLSGSWSGQSREEGRTAEFLFSSTDLVEWEYLHPLVEDGFYTEPGEDGAVPNFFTLGDRHALVFFSHKHGSQYYVGDYDPENHEFDIRTHGRLTHMVGVPGRLRGEGGHLNAPSVMRDGDRRIAFFNVLKGKPVGEWRDVMTVPRRLTLADDDTIDVTPVEELTALRTDTERIEDVTVPANETRVLDGIEGDSAEFEVVLEPEDARACGLKVLRSPDGAEHTTITYYPDTDSLGLDTTESTLRGDTHDRPPTAAPLVLGDDEPLRLRVFIDRSVVEVFANGRQAITSRVYPERDDSVGVAAFARRGDAELVSLDAHQMASIWV